MSREEELAAIAIELGDAEIAERISKLPFWHTHKEVAVVHFGDRGVPPGLYVALAMFAGHLQESEIFGEQQLVMSGTSIYRPADHEEMRERVLENEWYHREAEAKKNSA